MKVSMYRAKDGELFEKKADMEAHNIKLRLRPAVDEFVAAQPSSAFGFTVDGHDAIRRVDMADFIVANSDALRKILNESLIARRSRRAKKAAAQPAA